MTYKIRSVNISLILITSISLLVIASYGSIYLSTNNIVTKSNPILPILLFGGFIGAFLNLFFLNHRTSTCTLTKDTFILNGKNIKWTEIKSYKINNASAEFKTLKINTISGKSFFISHRKRFSKKDDFEKLMLAFENQVFYFRDKGFVIRKNLSIWDTNKGRFYGYIIVMLLIIYTVIVFTQDIKKMQLANYLIFLGLSIPLLLRIFRKKTTYGG